MDVDQALPGRGPRPCHRPHSPASLTFALGSEAIETATCGSAAPRHQLREEGAAAGERRGGGGAGGGAGAGGGPQAGAGKGARPPSRPPPRTIDTICGRCSRPTAPGVPFLPGSVDLGTARPLVVVVGACHRVRPETS